MKPSGLNLLKFWSSNCSLDWETKCLRETQELCQFCMAIQDTYGQFYPFSNWYVLRKYKLYIFLNKKVPWYLSHILCSTDNWKLRNSSLQFSVTINLPNCFTPYALLYTYVTQFTYELTAFLKKIVMKIKYQFLY